MAAAGNNIFLLKVIVRNVTLVDLSEATNECPLCVCFRFPGLVDITVCQGDYCGDGAVGGGAAWMSRGKSCLFAVNVADLCRTARDFRAQVSVYRRVDGTPETHFVDQTRLVAQTCVEFGQTFTEILLDPDQADKTSTFKRTLALYEAGHSTPVGTMDVTIHLTSHGDLLATEFSRTANSQKYDYKSLDEYMPAKIGCKKVCVVGECRKSCKHKDEQNTSEKDYCNKQMGQVKCVLTVMELMKKMFIDSAISSPTDLNEQQMTRKPCMFDIDCPMATCPFRAQEPITEPVKYRRKVSTTTNKKKAFRPITKKNNKKKHKPASTLVRSRNLFAKNRIEDDADMFVINVGRVDPCRIAVPVHRDNVTQVLDTDFQEFQPKPPPASKSKGGKKGGKKAGKKGGKKSAKK